MKSQGFINPGRLHIDVRVTVLDISAGLNEFFRPFQTFAHQLVINLHDSVMQASVIHHEGCCNVAPSCAAASTARSFPVVNF